MAFFNVRFYSEALGMQTEVFVILPQKKNNGEIGISAAKGGENAYRTLYLLHGLSDDHTIWMRRTSIERYADRYGICVVMPAAARSFYCDMKYGPAYYTYIAHELPERMREFFRLSDKREDNFVAGLSMGGYGALKIALRERDRFCAAAGLSSAIDTAARKDNATFRAIFGENAEVPAEDDLFRLAENTENRPRIFLGVGTEDRLWAENQTMKKVLEERGYDLTYRESPGNHNWDFWDEYIVYVLEWMFGKK